MNADVKSKQVAVLMGGPSSEHEVSLKSGRAVQAALDELGISNSAYVLHEAGLPEFDPLPDVVFVALHGFYGEDGQVQQALEAEGLRYTGSGAAASGITIDKWATKEAMRVLGIPTPESRILRRGDRCDLEGPLVVKPIFDGSSVGIHFVDSPDKLSDSFLSLFDKYESLLVEKRISGRECTVGILGGQALPIIEIIPQSGWYDFTAKYTAGKSTYEVPAHLEAELTQRIQQDALQLFTHLNCKGFARIDVLIDADHQPWFLEVNTIPGLTPTSLLPKASKAVGIGFNELILRMLNYAFSDDGK